MSKLSPPTVPFRGCTLFVGVHLKLGGYALISRGYTLYFVGYTLNFLRGTPYILGGILDNFGGYTLAIFGFTFWCILVLHIWYTLHFGIYFTFGTLCILGCPLYLWYTLHLALCAFDGTHSF